MSKDVNVPKTDVDETEYTTKFTSGLELMWGDGFLSPGGAEEVGLIVQNLDLHQKKVLDIGSGFGGPSICLASQHGASHVTGIDLETFNVERATKNAAKANLAKQVTFTTVEVGKFPFADEWFDFVFSKDAIIEVPNKTDIYSEAFRILRPGGRLAIGDWYCSSDPFTPEMIEWLSLTAVELQMITVDGAMAQLREVGFKDVEAADRNQWYREYSKREVEHMTGEARSKFDQLLGKDGAASWIKKTRLRSIAVAQGQLRPGHVRASRP